MKGLLGKIENAYRTGGLRGAVAKTLLGGCRRVVGYSRKEEIVSYIELTTESKVSLEARLTIRALEPRDRTIVAAFHHRHEVNSGQRDRVEAYFDHGCRAFLAFDEGELIGYLFWLKSEHPHLRIYDIQLKDDEVYGVDFYVAPPHRGESRALEFMDRALRALAEQGYTRMYGVVDAQKRPARWTYSVLGSRGHRTLIAHTFFRSVVMLNGKVFLAGKNKF